MTRMQHVFSRQLRQVRQWFALLASLAANSNRRHPRNPRLNLRKIRRNAALIVQNAMRRLALSVRAERHEPNGRIMKKPSKRNPPKDRDTMRPEYDFTKGVRGKHAARYAEGSNLVIFLEKDGEKVLPPTNV